MTAAVASLFLSCNSPSENTTHAPDSSHKVVYVSHPNIQYFRCRALAETTSESLPPGAVQIPVDPSSTSAKIIFEASGVIDSQHNGAVARFISKLDSFVCPKQAELLEGIVDDAACLRAAQALASPLYNSESILEVALQEVVKKYGSSLAYDEQTISEVVAAIDLLATRSAVDLSKKADGVRETICK